MVRSLIALLALGAAPAPQAGPAFTRLLDCRLPLAEAQSLVAPLAQLRLRDDSADEVTERTYFYDPAGVTAFGVPVRSVAFSEFRRPGQIEYAFAARVEGDPETWRARMLRHYSRTACDYLVSPAGNPVCLLHLGYESGPDKLDVDVQISQTAGRVQVECLYGDLPH
jgi:hypothetical protein